MYAKSIIEHVRGRMAAGDWTQQLSFVPVVMALAVAALPFTLDFRIEAFPSSSTAPQPEVVIAETPANTNMVKTVAGAGRMIPEDRRHAMIADYMARKFLVSRQVVLDLVRQAHLVGRQADPPVEGVAGEVVQCDANGHGAPFASVRCLANPAAIAAAERSPRACHTPPPVAQGGLIAPGPFAPKPEHAAVAQW